MPYTLTYVGLCLVIAVIGRRNKFGFWGYFFCSLVVTPLIGLLLILATERRPKHQV
jgi:hypothetical protein